MDDKALLHLKYQTQMQNIVPNALRDRKSFEAFVSQPFAAMKQVRIQEQNAQQGILYYTCWEANDVKHCMIPVFGYYAENGKMLSKLFQKLADDVVDDKKCEFFVHLYAQDEESIQMFHMLQFCTMAEKSIQRIAELDDAPSQTFDIRALSKADIQESWSEIWIHTNEIIEHLRKSPVFYPGTEFTESVYQQFFLDPATELIAAFSNNKIIGLIEWNPEAEGLVNASHRSVNVGEAYVVPEYRGTGLSRELLRFAQKRAKQAGAEYMWVEHGTANPNARGFWNHYFQTYQYELVREVQRCSR